MNLGQDQRFTSANSFSVEVNLEDSSTATTPNSVRAFAIKYLDKNRFRIRSVGQAADTVRVRYRITGD